MEDALAVLMSNESWNYTFFRSMEDRALYSFSLVCKQFYLYARMVELYREKIKNWGNENIVRIDFMGRGKLEVEFGRKDLFLACFNGKISTVIPQFTHGYVCDSGIGVYDQYKKNSILHMSRSYAFQIKLPVTKRRKAVYKRIYWTQRKTIGKNYIITRRDDS
jgi:hypothetical protein